MHGRLLSERETGRSLGWSNQTWFRAYDYTLLSEFEGLTDFRPSERNDAFSDTLSPGEIVDIIRQIGITDENAVNSEAIGEALKIIFGGGQPDLERKAIRGETALFIDMALDPFNRTGVDINGSLIK